MYQRLLILLMSAVVSTGLHAQYYEPFVHTGEFGASVGLGHYFGDLNTRANISRPKLAGGIFFRKQVSNYIGIKLAANYARLGFSDVYNRNETQRRRNLSFNSDVYEVSISGDFNFFKFMPGFEGYNYTPYVSLGVGLFSYDPFAYLGGRRFNLRELATEGQGSAQYPDRQVYGTTSLAVPLAVGFKYALSSNVNFYTELCYRFTGTDYLDDVSTTYAPDAFVSLPGGVQDPAFLLQDRSYETGTPIGVKGRQRGNSQQKDAFVTLQFGVSFNLSSYRCPTN